MNTETRNIELIEDLPELAIQDIWYTLLVYKGVRRGALGQFWSAAWREGEAPQHVNQDALNHIQETLRTIGLYYAVHTVVNDWGLEQPSSGRRRLSETCDIYIARTQEDADALLEARKNGDDATFGTLLGYPATAVAAYPSNILLGSDLEPELRDSEAGQLLYIALSKDHYKDELAEIQRWVDTVKASSEIIWSRLISGTTLSEE